MGYKDIMTTGEQLDAELRAGLTRIRLPRGEWFFDPGVPLGPAGGFGEVFAGIAHDGSVVAVKRLRITVGEAAHRELRIAEALEGRAFKHVLAILDSGDDADGGGYYVVMPRAVRSLADELETRGALPPADAVNALLQIALGLREVSHIVHRDLKPGNVLFHEERWKIADFGIARFVEDATSTNTLRSCLTPAYAAPEQWAGAHATGATDVYALACIGYELLRGDPPFLGPDIPDYRRQHTSEAPPQLEQADPRMRSLLSACLRKNPAGRPAVDRFIDVLQDVLHTPMPPRPAIAALQAINAIEAERVSQEGARAEQERRAAAERAALIDAATVTLNDIYVRLENLARDHLSESNIKLVGDGVLAIRIGNKALLEFAGQGGIPPNVQFQAARWEVVAIGWVRVTQYAPAKWRHGATLWYMRLAAHSSFRWFEVSYQRNGLVPEPPVGPFPIQDVAEKIYEHADAAAGPGLHTIELVAPPIAIDDENADAFCERWLGRLAAAYNGQLRPF
jgi:eukaryotic-like serine/threonine-protein kinase